MQEQNTIAAGSFGRKSSFFSMEEFMYFSMVVTGKEKRSLTVIE